MKFTSEDLMKAMGLQVGDRIILDNGSVYEIKKRDSEILLHYLYGTRVKKLSMHFEWLSLGYLYEKNFEILPRPKRVGDLKCGNFDGCDYGCPLCWMCCHYDSHIRKEHNDDTTLYEVLQNFNFDDDQEIYDLLKARLDKVVEE
jgi:hypothetical protein